MSNDGKPYYPEGGHNAMPIKRTRMVIAVVIVLLVQQYGLIKAVEHDGNNEPGCVRPEVENGLAGEIEGGIPVKDKYKDGETIPVDCKQNYRARGLRLYCKDGNPGGLDSMLCQGNTWSGKPECIPMGFCSKVLDIENGRVHQPDRATPNTTVTFSCLPGYMLIGNQKTATCQSTDGLYWTWNITKPPSCVKEQDLDIQPIQISMNHGTLSLLKNHSMVDKCSCSHGDEMQVEINISLAKNGQLITGKDCSCRDGDTSTTSMCAILGVIADAVFLFSFVGYVVIKVICPWCKRCYRWYKRITSPAGPESIPMHPSPEQDSSYAVHLEIPNTSQVKTTAKYQSRTTGVSPV